MSGAAEQRLAVGGVHALDGDRLVDVEPAGALEDLAWTEALVVRAGGEGTATLMRGDQRISLRMVTPAKLALVLVEDRVVVGERFHVRAVPHAADGGELEIGQWTEVAWQADGVAAPDGDGSAAEFGMPSTSFGVGSFRATAAGSGTVEARVGTAAGSLPVIAG